MSRIRVADTADEFAFLHSCGIGVRDIVKALGITPKSLEKALQRAGRGDLMPILRRAYLARNWADMETITEADRMVCGKCGRKYALSTEWSHRGERCTAAADRQQVAS